MQITSLSGSKFSAIQQAGRNQPLKWKFGVLEAAFGGGFRLRAAGDQGAQIQVASTLKLQYNVASALLLFCVLIRYLHHRRDMSQRRFFYNYGEIFRLAGACGLA